VICRCRRAGLAEQDVIDDALARFWRRGEESTDPAPDDPINYMTAMMKNIVTNAHRAWKKVESEGADRHRRRSGPYRARRRLGTRADGRAIRVDPEPRTRGRGAGGHRDGGRLERRSIGGAHLPRSVR
jgi:hypothetical protein